MRFSRAWSVLLLVVASACASGAPPSTAALGGGLPAQESGRQVAVRAFVEITVADVSAASRAAEEVVLGTGGFLQSSRTVPDQRVELAFRVPAAEMGGVLEAFRGLGQVDHESRTTADVTDEVVDLEARLQNLTELRDRLRGYLDQSQSLEEIIAVESELARVQTELDRVSASLERLQTDVATSLLSLTLKRKRTLGPLGLLGYAVVWTVEKLFFIR